MGELKILFAGWSLLVGGGLLNQKKAEERHRAAAILSLGSLHRSKQQPSGYTLRDTRTLSKKGQGTEAGLRLEELEGGLWGRGGSERRSKIN